MQFYRLILRNSHQYVPKHNPTIETDICSLSNFINSAEKIVVVTGAGVSTESGIPDYRSEGVGLYARSNHKPVQYKDFLKSQAIRQRYWARNFIGWPKFSQTQPNQCHLALKRLQDITGKLTCLITQNVDRLHSKAGSNNVIELHGTAFRVICLDCNAQYDRHDVQKQIQNLNPGILGRSTEMVRPDGDVEISMDDLANFQVPTCAKCGGVLKPDITFFGDNVPRHRVEQVKRNVSESDAILVLGSSLTVFSGYRIVLQGVDEQKKVAIVNIGPTRADHLANLKVEARCGDVLPKLLECL